MTSSTEHAHAEGSTRVFLIVWFWLLALTGVEVFLGYKQLELKLMLVLLMGLSVIKAALIIAYFMHLRYETAQHGGHPDAGAGHRDCADEYLPPRQPAAAAYEAALEQ